MTFTFSGQERKDFYENKTSILSNWLDDDEDTETHSNVLCLLVYPQLNRQALPVIKLCLNTSKGPVSFGAIGLLLEAEKNRLILIKILSSFKGSTIKSWSLLPIVTLAVEHTFSNVTLFKATTFLLGTYKWQFYHWWWLNRWILNIRLFWPKLYST